MEEGVRDRNATILIAEDETGIAQMLADRLAVHGFRTVIAENGQRALQLAQERRFEVAIVDLYMPHVDGLAFIEALRAGGDDTPVILMSAGIDAPLIAMRVNAEHFLEKPFAFEEALWAIESVLARRSMDRAPSPG